MKKLSITKLELARTAPTSIAQKLIDDKLGSGPLTDTAERHLISAIKHYQKHEDLSKALDSYYSSTANAPTDSTMAKKKDEVGKLLQEYVDLSEANGFRRIGDEHNIKYVLSDSLTLTGRIPPILKDNKGKIVTLFLDRYFNNGWGQELKFPFIQMLLQRDFAIIPNSGFEVGVFALDGCKLQTKSYTPTEIDKAMVEIQSIADKITDFINLQKSSTTRTAAIRDVFGSVSVKR